MYCIVKRVQLQVFGRGVDKETLAQRFMADGDAI